MNYYRFFGGLALGIIGVTIAKYSDLGWFGFAIGLFVAFSGGFLMGRS